MSNVTDLTTDDNNISTHAKLYVEKHNWFIVPLKGGDKMPVADNWSEAENTLNKYSDTIPPNLQGIGLAHKYSRTVSIDFDKLGESATYFKEHYELDIWDYLNDPRALKNVSGRENRAKLIYALPSDVDPLPSVKKDAEGFELRCATKKGTTLQDVLPPSIHPKTGKPYSWEQEIWDRDKSPIPEYVPIMPEPLLNAWQHMLERHNTRTWDVENLDLIEPFALSALNAIDPDCEYDPWLNIGMALDTVGLGDHWDDWSQGGSKYRPGDCEMRLLGFVDDGGVTLGTLWHHAREAGWNPKDSWASTIASIEENASPDDVDGCVKKLVTLIKICNPGSAERGQACTRLAKSLKVRVKDFETDVRLGLQDSGRRTDMTHKDIAEDYYKSLGNAVATEGAMWVYKTDRWIERDFWHIVHDVGAKYREQDRCANGSQYNQIAKLVVQRNVDPGFFIDAPLGMSATDGFYELKRDGTIQRHAHLPEQRRRYVFDGVPAEGDLTMLNTLLECCSPDSRELIQQFFGAIMFQMCTDYQQALLLYGETGTGKSALINLLQDILPKTSVVPPHKFSEDYWRAELAGSLMNSHAELPANTAVDSADFKAVMAGDLISARVVHQPVFKFHPIAGHIFSANTLPKVELAEAAFWRRWLLVEYTGKPKQIIRHLHKQVIEREMPALLHWGMEGAKKLMANDGYVLGATHDRLLEMWKERHNIVKQALHADDTPFILNPDMRCPIRKFQEAVHIWCLENGIVPTTKKDVSILAKLEFETVVLDGYTLLKGVGIALDE